MSSRIVQIGLFVVALGIVGGVIFASKPNNQSEISVQLKWEHNAQFAGMYVAEDKGYYQDSGLSVKFLERTDASLSTTDMVASGETTFGMVSTPEFFTALEAGKDIVAVAAFFQNSPSAIFALKESGITKPADLRGKSVGVSNVSKRTTLFVNSVLEAAGVKSSEVTLVEIGFEAVDALLKGKVDAVSMYRTGDQYLLDQAGASYTTILPEENGIHSYNDILITSRAFAENNHDVVDNFMEATRKGWTYALAHKDEALLSTLARASGKYKDAEYEAYILDKSAPLMIPEKGGPEDIGQMSPSVWDDTYALYRTHGLIGPVEIYKYFLPRYFFK